MHTPLLSIIVPVYNAPAPLLSRLLTSVLCQTLSALEVIAVDDASSGECGRMLDEAAAADCRVTVIHRRANGRAGAARNDGLDVARGEYVLFVDADDVLRDDMCEALVAKAREYDADMVQGSWFETAAAGNTLKQCRLPEQTYDLSRSCDRMRCLRCLRFAPWGKLFRREALGELRFETFEANIGEDTLFNVAAVCRIRRMVTTSCMGYGYTVHGESATGRAAKGMPYLRTIIASNRRIREVLRAQDESQASRSAADWLTLKRFTTGCEWIGEVQNDDERRAMWDYWRRYFHDTLAPGIEQHRGLLGWYRLALSGGPAYAGKVTRMAVRVVDRFTRGAWELRWC